jgi:septation ring formation regulator EzrA
MERVQRVESIKDMDQKELEEALPRLREEAAKAEEALRVAQERLHEAGHRQAKIPTFVEVHDDHLVVDRRGWDKMVKLLGRLTIPLDHVVRAEADPNIEWAVWRDGEYRECAFRGYASTTCTVTETKPL